MENKKKNYANEHPKHKITYKSTSEGGPKGWEAHDKFYDKFGKYLTPYWYMEKISKKKTKD